MAQKYSRLRLVLGDQLNIKHTWFKNQSSEVLYVLMETLSETNYVRHHIQKVAGFFLAMRAFAAELEKQGHHVHYIRLDGQNNEQSISGNIQNLIRQFDIQHFEYLLPDEYRLDKELRNLCQGLSIQSRSSDTEHFLTSRMEARDFFEGKKSFLMERFYRYMRKKYGILMEEDGETPLTGQWNYDQDNRKKLPERQPIPSPLHFDRNISSLVEMLNEKQVATIGQVDEARFTWPVTRKECLSLLDYFVNHQLTLFGTYQDAMSERGYLLFHSKLSFALNVKLLHPLEVINACVQHWKANQDSIHIAQAEGFVRQILGWREYMRGIYWAKMPGYAEMNFFSHQARLPEWYWTGNTKMNCLKNAIGQSLENAYAHHIQRLMVTGNFALLLGVHPDELDQWYLGIYMDAIEWVEVTNTRGMSQFADGGIVGTKPYVSSANYIHKMGDYCSNCPYDHKARYGQNACPFNSLYWDFYDRHTDKLSNNPRISMMYRLWSKMEGEEKAKVLRQAAAYKERADAL